MESVLISLATEDKFELDLRQTMWHKGRVPSASFFLLVPLPLEEEHAAQLRWKGKA